MTNREFREHLAAIVARQNREAAAQAELQSTSSKPAGSEGPTGKAKRKAAGSR